MYFMREIRLRRVSELTIRDRSINFFIHKIKKKKGSEAAIEPFSEPFLCPMHESISSNAITLYAAPIA